MAGYLNKTIITSAAVTASATSAAFSTPTTSYSPPLESIGFSSAIFVQDISVVSGTNPTWDERFQFKVTGMSANCDLLKVDGSQVMFPQATAAGTNMTLFDGVVPDTLYTVYVIGGTSTPTFTRAIIGIFGG